MASKNAGTVLSAYGMIICLSVPTVAISAEDAQVNSFGSPISNVVMSRLVDTSETSMDMLQLDIPATRMVLDNGLTLVVHEDHTQPLVSVSTWYHVGSKNEPVGKTGFAHLFEHLMFNGSENYNHDFHKAAEMIGATGVNGTTSFDRTNYYQTVPKNALNTILWLESDRMGHFLGAVDQEKLDTQRQVVKNEKLKNAEAPYGKAPELIYKATTPFGHPYNHTTIGSMEDLDAASLEDVKNWFKSYYGPSNAVLVLAGDITPEEALKKVEIYFGNIPAGEPIVQMKNLTVNMTESVREVAEDDVAQTRIYRVWNTPNIVSLSSTDLHILGSILGGDETSRLYRRLVIDDQLATSVSAFQSSDELSGNFIIIADVKEGVDPSLVEDAINEELTALINSGPTVEEMDKARAYFLSGTARLLESTSKKAEILAESTTYMNDPDGWKTAVERVKVVKNADIQNAAKMWLTKHDYVLQVVPFGTHSVSGQEADRSTLPLPTENAIAHFPDVERATLENGMELLVARRAGAPVINFSMLFKNGIAENWESVTEGTSSIALDLLNKGTDTRTQEEITNELGLLGATLQTSGGLENSTVRLSSLKSNVADSLSIYANVLMDPAFPQIELDQMKTLWLAELDQARITPAMTADRVLPELIFGVDTPYGRMISEDTINSIDRDDVVEFYNRWFHPNNAKLVITGDTTLAEIRPLIEKTFHEWTKKSVPKPLILKKAQKKEASVYLIDKPGALQSLVIASVIAPPRTEGNEIARILFTQIFGGTFTSRVNTNLREDKGWTYGASSYFYGRIGGRIFNTNAEVQTDKTAESMNEIDGLIQSIVSDQKIETDELEKIKNDIILSLPSYWSSSNGIAQEIIYQTKYNLPNDFSKRYPELVEAIGLEEVNAAASEVLRDNPITWLVIGDRSKIEDKIKALQLGTFHVIDANGEIVQ